MATTCDDGVRSGELCPHCRIVEIRNPVPDRSTHSAFAECRKTFTTERVGGAPGAGRIHNGLGEHPILGSVPAPQVNREGFAVASGVDDQVTSASSYADHLGVELDQVGEGRGEWFEVELAPLPAGRIGLPVG